VLKLPTKMGTDLFKEHVITKMIYNGNSSQVMEDILLETETHMSSITPVQETETEIPLLDIDNMENPIKSGHLNQ